MILETLQSPADVKRLSAADTEQLCDELRQFLVEQVSRTGGHLASNLGTVELTVAIHRVFDTSSDRLVFDVGHQCYVHKALTGRRELFGTLRQFGATPQTPGPRRWAWHGRGRRWVRTTTCWPSSAMARWAAASALRG